MNKKERTNRFKSLSSSERKALIIKKMKEKGINLGSGIPNKIYNSYDIYELIQIAKGFQELREKK